MHENLKKDAVSISYVDATLRNLMKASQQVVCDVSSASQKLKYIKPTIPTCIKEHYAQ